MARLISLHFIACAAPALLLVSANVHAQAPIGGAAIVVNDVRGESAGKRARITLGDRVFANQGVQTAARSMTKLVFLDDTNMTIGPDSRAKLDSFVFDPNGSGKNIAVTATRGAFRFVSGSSPSEAYRVTTPQAHIGVRGTTYDVRIQRGRTLVVLQEGAVNVCLRNRSLCRDLTQPGQSLVVTDNEIAGPISPANKPWDFGQLCSGGASALCGVTQFAALPAPVRRAQAAPPRRRAAPPRRAASPPRAQPRPTRVVRPPRTIIVEDYPIYVGRPAPIIVGVGEVAPPPRGGWRPRPGPGWRPPGVLPPPKGGRRPGDRVRPVAPPSHGGVGRPHRQRIDRSHRGGAERSTRVRAERPSRGRGEGRVR